MSFTDPSAEPAQPQEGQDGGGGGNPAYAEYLERITDDDARGVAEEAFKAWDANYQRTSQEAADYRKTWEPYEQLGVSQVDPEALQWSIQLGQLAQDPQAFQEWFQNQYAQANGLTPQEAQQQQQYGQEDGGFYDPAQQQQQQFEQLLQEKLGPVSQQLEQFQQWQQQLEDGAREQQIKDQIDHEIQALQSQHADSIPEKIREQFPDLIERFAMKYAEPGSDPKQVIAKAWGDMQTFMNAADMAALQSKAGAPGPAEGGGVPDVNPEKFKSIMDPRVQEQAKEFLRAGRGQ